VLKKILVLAHLRKPARIDISAPLATASMVENYLDRPGVADLFEIENGIASLIDMEVPAKARVVGHVIKDKDIDIPDQCVVAALIRDESFVVPRSKTEILAGDHVVFVGTSEAIHDANAIFKDVKE